MDRALIIEARFYDEIANLLLEGASARLAAAGFSIVRLTVPGCLEIPPALAMTIAADRRADRPHPPVVLLGCVIRGETTHYETVANETNRAVMDLAVAHRLALGNGILTVENRNQALTRARRTESDKGGAAANAALALHRLRGEFQ